MLGYWVALLSFALFTTCLFGPPLWFSMRGTLLYLPGAFQDMGLGVVIILGICLHPRVRAFPRDTRTYIGLLLGLSSLPAGYVTYALTGLLCHIVALIQGRKLP